MVDFGSDGPTVSAVTLPFVKMDRKTSTASSVSVRPLCGWRTRSRSGLAIGPPSGGMIFN